MEEYIPYKAKMGRKARRCSLFVYWLLFLTLDIPRNFFPLLFPFWDESSIFFQVSWQLARVFFCAALLKICCVSLKPSNPNLSQIYLSGLSPSQLPSLLHWETVIIHCKKLTPSLDVYLFLIVSIYSYFILDCSDVLGAIRRQTRTLMTASFLMTFGGQWARSKKSCHWGHENGRTDGVKQRTWTVKVPMTEKSSQNAMQGIFVNGEDAPCCAI